MNKFNLGKTVVTNGIAKLIFDNDFDKSERINKELIKCLLMHQKGDWGNLDEDDKMLNDTAVENGGRILSAYEIGKNKVKIWIITEADRSYTTILLPEEY